MKKETAKNVVIVFLSAALIFMAGMFFGSPIQSQGIPGRRFPKPSPPPKPKPSTGVLPYVSKRMSMAGSGGDIIAITGDYGVGTSVLYVIDTKEKVLSVYEARGGSKASRRVVWVGARRIDLDLKIQSYNDESEVSYKELQDIFNKRGLLSPGKKRNPSYKK